MDDEPKFVKRVNGEKLFGIPCYKPERGEWIIKWVNRKGEDRGVSPPKPNALKWLQDNPVKGSDMNARAHLWLNNMIRNSDWFIQAMKNLRRMHR